MTINEIDRIDQASIDEALRQAIITGRIEPGSWLREEALSRELGVSRTPLREALGRLSKEGMLARIPRRGFRAMELDQSELEELYEVLATIELQSMNSAAVHDKTLLEDLQRLRLDDIKSSDASRNFERDFKWHSRLVAACENTVLIEMHRDLLTRLSRYFHLFWEAVDDHARSQQEHEFIEQALLTGDLELAQAHLKSHRRLGMERIRDYMASLKSHPAQTGTHPDTTLRN
jgi:DNA-binding GntR family transcriptional regulator